MELEIISKESNLDNESKTDKAPAKWVLAIATFFGLGYSPFAPGTVGSLGAIILYLALAGLPWYFYLAACFIIFALACYSAQAVQDATGIEDPSLVVIDEVIGYLVAMFMLPDSAGYIVAAFFIFRALDITKPWPASYFDKKVQNGFGIVLDDVAAGIYTNIILQFFRLVWG